LFAGRVDGIVCSTDKNFLVPVGKCRTRLLETLTRFSTYASDPKPGGAIIVSPNKKVVENVGKVYAGRASSSPIVDLFITLLSMGLSGYKRLLAERTAMMEKFPQRFQEVAEKYGERVLSCPANTISFGMTLDGLGRPKKEDENDADYAKSVEKEISSLGSMLFSRCVSGTRVVPRAQVKAMGGHELIGFGSSTSNYAHSYMTAACAIGVSVAEIDEFLVRLDKTLAEFYSKKNKVSK
jgi:O-phospho-L-seryl-tRNASec:L-selenocysteinyl-tRNA synthase